MKIAVVTGTRPETLKNYSIVAALRRFGVSFSVLHTNQHSERLMCDAIFDEMG
jgi:UDP-N-acetylglucosamine 2-epimerase (non-hydrolysing)